MSDKTSDSPIDRPTEPQHISSTCETCWSGLVLYSTLTRDKVEESSELSVKNFEAGSEGYDDEWVCPECLDGIRLDMGM